MKIHRAFSRNTIEHFLDMLSDIIYAAEEKDNDTVIGIAEDIMSQLEAEED